MADDSKIPKGRVRRSAKLGSIVGVQGARYAGTKATNVARSEEGGREHLEQRHLETAIKMVGALGQMKGAAMKLGQFASFIDTEFIPEEYREIYQEQLAKLRTDAPAMPWEKVEKVIEEEYDGESLSELFAEFETEAFAAASIGQVHRAELLDGRQVAVKIQYPGIAEALEADLRNAGTIVRLGRALAPGLDAKAIAEELRERVMEELDYEYEAQNQRSFARAYRDHPFIYVPEVVTRLSRRRILVTELVEGMGFEQIKQLPHEERSRFGEIVFRGSFGSIYHLQHFNADPHPGNYILMGDGRVAFLDFGMTKKLDREQILLEQQAFDAASRNDPEAFRRSLHDLGFIKKPSKLDAQRLMDHMLSVGGWYIEDREIEITARRVMKIIESTNDPRSEYYDLMRRESIPADELMGRRMEIGVVAVLGQLKAKRNWHRIMREWVYADPPATELGAQEWEYFEERGLSEPRDSPKPHETSGRPEEGGMSRIRRGWGLTKKSWGLLNEHRALIRFPLYGGIATTLLAIVFLGPGLLLLDKGTLGGAIPLLVIGVYVLSVVGFYFSVALAAAADMIFRGEEATVADGLAVARGRFTQICGWAAISTAISVAMAALENQGGIAGQIAARLVGLAWSLVTFLAVPVIAIEGTGPVETLKRSASIFRQRWGQQITGNIAIGAAVFLIGVLPAAILIVAGVALWSSASFLGALLVVVGALLLAIAMLISRALSGIFGVALYRYALDGNAVGGFTPEELESAVKVKKGNRGTPPTATPGTV